MTAPHGMIHHFTYNPKKGEVFLDEYNEPLIGFYYEILNENGEALIPLFGPYANKDECEAACNRAWKAL